MRMLRSRLLDKYTSYIVVDGNDNSVTLSSGLARQCGIFSKVIDGGLIVKVNADDYAVVFKENGRTDIPLAYPIQYNPIYKSLGFESLTPMVNRVLADYGCEVLTKQRFKVKKMSRNGIDFYNICRRK